MRIQGNTRFHARFLNSRYRPMQMGTCLIMHVHHIGSRSRDLRDKLLGLHDHQVHIHRLLAYRL